MLNKRDLVRVFVKGGIISPGDLLKIIITAEELGADYIHFGSRQDILFPVAEKKRDTLEATFKSIQTQYDCDEDGYQNIVSSYAALDVMASSSWLAPHMYHYILDTFDYQPHIKINVVDPAQSMVPLYTGHLNFIASEKENYWFCYIRSSDSDTKLWKCPELIYSFDLVKISRFIEQNELLNEDTNWDEEWKKIKSSSSLELNTVPIENQLAVPSDPFPYYEGMNRLPDGKYWLGLYWRNNKYSISFLKVLCLLCQDTKVGKISLTPWKSFIVKGIDKRELITWEKLLGKFGLNVRHSALELNWHLPVLDEEALALKNYLVRALDKQDISTYGLTFTIKKNALILFTTVVIERTLKDDNWNNDTYNILYAKGFDPNNSEYTYYARDVRKETLPTLMIEVSHMYYEQLDTPSYLSESDTPVEHKVQLNYQCPNCLTVYDESLGDPEQNIKEGTLFMLLPDDYECSVCGNPKDTFVEMVGNGNANVE
ncbi:rubredoxin [Sediminitomix flava]|uniref:Rubredoxin n=1 Tax=Sediminitomix flava TaxID=379075 RepID=A0A315ZBY9_SEDFL|nr:rubredoxin [Sediminitomix flava]PWJ42880.1 rubredoxin [Sediminitomix flava]